MRTAIVSDVHANIEALEACLREADKSKVDRVACLGDVVGYNASPNETAEKIRKISVLTIQGNHDFVAAGLADPADLDFNAAADSAIRWTKSVLSEENRSWLEKLPESSPLDGNVLLVHGSPRNQNEYILTPFDLEMNVRYVRESHPDVKTIFFGHTHYPALINADGPGSAAERHGDTFQLKKGALYFINPGSVGQPRDGRPLSSFVIFDDASHTVTFLRVAYDVDAAAKKNEAANIHPFLTERLRLGI